MYVFPNCFFLRPTYRMYGMSITCIFGWRTSLKTSFTLSRNPLAFDFKSPDPYESASSPLSTASVAELNASFAAPAIFFTKFIMVLAVFLK